MAIVSIKNKSKSGSLLVGNTFWEPGTYESIATATGTGASGTITFSNIPATYTHLQIRGIMRTDESGATKTNCYLYANGATGSVYTYHYLYGNGAVTSAAGTASSTFTFPGNATAASSAAGNMGVLLTNILDYVSTIKYKTFRNFVSHDQNGSGEIFISSGLYQSTNAITSIEIKTSSNNWTTGTTFALYGIKAE